MKNRRNRRLSHLATAALTLVVLAATMLYASPSADSFQQFDGGHPCWDGVSSDGELVNGQCYQDWGPAVCAEGLTFVYDPVTNEHCASVEEPIIELINCPAGSLSSPDGCYELVAKGPHGEPYCVNGILAGANCAILGVPIIVTRAGPLCPSGFGVVDGKCLRYETPLNGPPQCPIGSLEDAAGDCRKPVPGGNKEFVCANPAAELTSQGCEITTVVSVCLNGYMDAAVSNGCVELLPGPYCAGQLVTINLQLTPTSVGTPGDDVVWGTPGDDVFFGLGGNDIVCARAGNDLIMTGNGDDIVFGEAGNDRIHVRGGNDEAHGGLGDDYLDGFTGKDHCDGGEGTDTATSHCESTVNVP